MDSPVYAWGVDRTDQTTGMNNQYQYERNGTNVDVYILDTGIFIENDEFEGRASRGGDFTGEGDYDGHGHGTHVAGTLHYIASLSCYQIQISHLVHVCACHSISILGTVGSKRYGIAKNVNLIAVKVLNRYGRGCGARIIAAIDWVIRQPRPNGAVINMSLGSKSVWKPMNDAVERAVAAGVHVVVSAGNSNSDACGASPASAVNAITVGATGQDDARASFSNYGECLDMFAPGVSIPSTSLWNGYYTIGSGTSMAAPHVAGVAALLLQEDPTLTPAQLRDRVRTDATAGIVTDEQVGSPNLLLNTEAINERALNPPPPAPPASVAASLAPSATPTSAPNASPSTGSGMRHVPNTYCAYYESGGGGGCSGGKPFAEVWQKCLEDGSDVCMGIMWNSCSGPTSDTSVNGAWKLMKAGQEIGTADSPTATCGGKRQALGHWDVFVRDDTPTSAPAYIEVDSESCEFHGFKTVTDTEECTTAASKLGKTITWGPYGGYSNVVTGCSIRWDIHLFFNPEGICDPSAYPNHWASTGCKCARKEPCLCIVE
jgi:hypothetical protein